MQVVERDVVRLVVLDSDDRMLLFHTHDPAYPEQGIWWELPGGGLEPGETYRAAAIRELAEVTGSRDRFYPGRLPDLLAPFLAGDQIDEPFEEWS